MKKLLTIFAILLASATAQAGLILHISPDGATGTRWEFTGSTIVNFDGGNNSFWGENSGSLANVDSGSHNILTGGGTLFSTSSGTHTVENVWASTHTFDGVSPRVGFLDWSAGDVLSWSGDLTSTLLFANLNIGSISTNNILGGDITEALTITVSNTAMAAVPSPSTVAIFALGIMGLATRKFMKQ